jgi:hypothetical protein
MGAEITEIIRWISIALSLFGTFHVLKYKKDPRAALGWMESCGSMLPSALCSIFSLESIASGGRQS